VVAMAMLALILAGCAPAAGGRAVAGQTTAPQPAATVILGSELEARYGLHVNLIAVTAAGGLVDVRLKAPDANKAKQLLQNGAPSLLVDHSGVVLVAPDDSQAQIQYLQDDGPLFFLYPNSGNAVRPGDNVTVMFGDVRLEPIAAK
jgi:hypothetical protein